MSKTTTKVLDAFNRRTEILARALTAPPAAPAAPAPAAPAPAAAAPAPAAAAPPVPPAAPAVKPLAEVPREEILTAAAAGGKRGHMLGVLGLHARGMAIHGKR